jgi:predicted RNA-binding Zn-ribbon protein involved in translation (DUF1610 family)
MDKNLKNLDRYNIQQNHSYWMLNSNEPQLNGISCPKCGEELYDTNPMITLPSMPPQKNINCDNCGFVGYRAE